MADRRAEAGGFRRLRDVREELLLSPKELPEKTLKAVWLALECLSDGLSGTGLLLHRHDLQNLPDRRNVGGMIFKTYRIEEILEL